MIFRPFVLLFSARVATVAAAALALGCAATTPKPATSVAEQPTHALPAPPRTPPSTPVADALDHFVPGGWAIFARARADLDQDGRQDIVALIEHNQSGQTVDSYPMPQRRYVLIVVQDEPIPRLAAMNPQVLRPENAFGMYPPSVELDAGHGRFSITQSGGSAGHRWSYTLDFQHDRTRAAWYLAACAFEKNSRDVRGRPQTSTGEHSYTYTLKNDFGHFDREEFRGFCPKL